MIFTLRARKLFPNFYFFPGNFQIRSVALRNALPSTSSISSRSYDYPSSSLSSLYSSRNLNSDSGSKLSEKKSLLSSDYSAKNGGSSSYRSSLATNSISPSKSPNRDSTSEKKAQVEGLCGLWNIGNTCFMVRNFCKI